MCSSELSKVRAVPVFENSFLEIGARVTVFLQGDAFTLPSIEVSAIWGHLSPVMRPEMPELQSSGS